MIKEIERDIRERVREIERITKRDERGGERSVDCFFALCDTQAIRKPYGTLRWGTPALLPIALWLSLSICHASFCFFSMIYSLSLSPSSLALSLCLFLPLFLSLPLLHSLTLSLSHSFSLSFYLAPWKHSNKIEHKAQDYTK